MVKKPFHKPRPKIHRKKKGNSTSKLIHHLLEEGVEAWNSYRRHHSEWHPNLEHLNFSGRYMAGIDFSNLNLRNANLSNCDLTNARLRDATVTFTNFKNAILNDADFKGAKNLTKSQLESAREARSVLFDAAKFSEPKLPGDVPQVFLSYAWDDKSAVLAVDQWLRDHGARVLLDERNFLVGESIREEILRWIKAAGVIVCFISKNSKDRHYPKLEREIAETLRGKGDARVVYFTLDDTILDILQESRLYIPGHSLSFQEACEILWRGILKAVGVSTQVNLKPFKMAGKDWTKLGD